MSRKKNTCFKVFFEKLIKKIYARITTDDSTALFFFFFFLSSKLYYISVFKDVQPLNFCIFKVFFLHRSTSFCSKY